MKVSIRKVVFTSVSLTMLCLMGCSSLVVRPVSESSKINNDLYDGSWVATVIKTPGLQYGPGNWRFNCGDLAGESIGVFTVREGQALMSWDDNGGSPAYINEKGKFRFEIPTGTKASVSGISDSTISNGDETALIFGSLQTGKGKFTLGVAELSNAGCTSTVEFTRV